LVLALVVVLERKGKITNEDDNKDEEGYGNSPHAPMDECPGRAECATELTRPPAV
jgi:hypothetical protein